MEIEKQGSFFSRIDPFGSRVLPAKRLKRFQQVICSLNLLSTPLINHLDNGFHDLPLYIIPVCFRCQQDQPEPAFRAIGCIHGLCMILFTHFLGGYMYKTKQPKVITINIDALVKSQKVNFQPQHIV
ncbi:MAG: hypothetical protein U9R20_06975 [Thermodesulfobacteriota bacterium]|nr:hypothetical protein [Thermodesulfobacteriota bacterium]